MTGVSLHVDRSDFAKGFALADRLVGWQVAELADAASELLASQTQRRIDEDKAAPDGTPWADWSDDYAATRHGGHSLLQGRNHLLPSIQGYATAEEAVAGSNLDYAAVHQNGSEDGDTPARPYLGLSRDDEVELRALVEGFVEGAIQ